MNPFLYVYTLPNKTTGIDDITSQVASAVGSFTPLLLAFVYFVVFLGGMARQKARIGTSDAPMWATVAGLSTLIVALVLSTVTGIISLTWLTIVVVVTIFSGVWLFLDRKPSEL